MTVHLLARGIIRCPDRDGYTDEPGMVAVHDLTTDQRTGLRLPAITRPAILTAVIDWNTSLGIPVPDRVHRAEAGRLWVRLAEGHPVARQTVIGLNAPDLVGCADDDGWRWLEHEAVELVEDRTGALELHLGCPCRIAETEFRRPGEARPEPAGSPDARPAGIGGSDTRTSRTQ